MSWQVIIEILEGIQFAMEAVTFTEFIYEEALQTASMAVRISMQNQNYAMAKAHLNQLESSLYQTFKEYVDKIGWLSPYSWGAYKAYANAVAIQIEAYKEALKYT